MELRQIRYFVAVAEHLHFRQASEAIHIAQPSLSQQIHQLEDELGTPLFERNHRKVTLTPAGQRFYEKARALLRDAETAMEETRRVASGHAGLLTVGFVTSAAVHVLPTTLKTFRARHPRVEVRLLESSPREQLTALYERSVDIGLCIAWINDPIFETLELASSHLVAALPREHPLAQAEAVDIRDLVPEVLIVPEKNPVPGFYEHVHLAFQAEGIRPGRELHTRLIHTGILLVGSGLGVSLVPDSFAGFQTPGVVFRALRPALPPIALTAVWRKEDPSPQLTRYVEVLSAYAARTTERPLSAGQPISR